MTNLADDHQGLVATLPFERAEYSRRLQRTREAMRQQGLDVLIISDPTNMHWLTGYDGWSFYVHQCVLVSHDDAPLWFGREMDRNGARRTVVMADDHLFGYPDTYVQSTDRHPMDWLSREILIPRNWARARIGVEMDNYYFSAAAFAALQKHLPDAHWADATGLVNWRRAIKSPREIEYMRIAAQIVEAMHRRIIEVVEPGMRKNELVAHIYQAGLLGIEGHGGDYPAIVPMVPTGRDATAPHLTWTDAPIPEQSVTFFEIAGCYRRYHCPQSRTVYLGSPPADLLRAEQVVIEGIAASLDKARPGNTCEDVAEAFFKVLHGGGFQKSSRCGYSIGASYPPDWGERTMSLRAGDRSVLEPGMTFHFMPALWEAQWGLEITEAILITPDGAEPLCQTPRQLFVKD
ncbi:ectoine hydrolase DoeA [Castellaniella sp.]|uniref:ectoine hydrolase DoeA n=1 Tax=Castellaniella sp. TaxID=1955812 RepID=UPI00356918C4